jgi:hypothetical protein
MSRIPIPREHGAWAMLYVPFVIGVATVDHFVWRAIPFLLGMTAAFFAHEPLVTALRLDPSRPQNRERRQQLVFWLIVFLAIAAMSILPLVIVDHLWYLLVLGGATGLLLLLHGYLVSELSQRSFAAEFLGVLCLTSSSAAARYVLLCSLDRMAFVLWVLNILYFSSSIFYVKMRVSRYAKKPDSRSLTLQCAAYHIVLLVCLVLFVLRGEGSFLAALAFAPILIRTFYAMLFPQASLNLKRIGLAEIAYSLAFVVLLSFGMRP